MQNRYRKVHLDQHISPLIGGFAFDKRAFQKKLQEGRISEITLFAKCHHGYTYYPTKVGTRHPKLNFDLLGEQISAAREIGVKANIYIPVGWSELDALQHPEWRAYNYKTKKILCSWYDYDKTYGAATDDTPKPGTLWLNLCPGSGYLDYLKRLTGEVCERYKPIDGIFFDICFAETSCGCPSCLKGMKEAGLDINSIDDAKKYYSRTRIKMMSELNDIIREFSPSATIFYNGIAEKIFDGVDYSQYYPYITHFEIEELSSNEGNYDKVCLKSKCFEKFGKPICGMTGRFNLSWGEFGGYKNVDTLRYECAYALSLGIGICVGDQLSPSGKTDEETYRLIGKVYKDYEALEDVCFPSESVTDLGVVISEDRSVNEGLNYMLSELHCDYSIIEEDSFFDKYRCIIVPDRCHVSDVLKERLINYCSKGGKLILSGDAVNYFSQFGVDYLGQSESDVDYILCDKVLDSAVVSYRPAHIVKCSDKQVSAKVYNPCFNRTYGHFCSHLHSPPKDESEKYPALIEEKKYSYIAHDIFGEYYDYGQEYMRNYFSYILFNKYTAKVKIDGLMSGGRVRLRENTKKSQLMLHVLYAPITKKGKQYIVADLPVVNGLTARIETEKVIKSVISCPEEQPLEFEQENGVVTFKLPPLSCHSLIVLKY